MIRPGKILASESKISSPAWSITCPDAREGEVLRKP